MGKCVTNAASTTYNDAMQWGQSVVEAAFVTHFPIPPIYPYLPFTPGPGYLVLCLIALQVYAFLKYLGVM